MGNCVEVLWRQQEEEEEEGRTRKRKEEREKKGRMRIKVVLSKEELQWLMEQIKERGGKGLEELLEEIERGRKKGVNYMDDHHQNSYNLNASWRPSLESITECPELPDQMQR